jgi:hypothetical protein
MCGSEREVVMRYLFGFMSVCALGMVASASCGPSLPPPSDPCSGPQACTFCDELQDCVLHACNPGYEHYCRPVDSGGGYCDCTEVSGTGGTPGTGGTGGSAGSGGSGSECGRGVPCDGEDPNNSCASVCEDVCGSGNVNQHYCFSNEDLEYRCYCTCNSGECIGG